MKAIYLIYILIINIIVFKNIYCQDGSDININLGEIVNPSENIHLNVFWKNTSGKNLKIKSIHTSCSCTSAFAKKNYVESSKKFEFDIQIDVQKRTGEFNAVALIEFTDLNIKPLRIDIEAYINKVLILSPTASTFFYKSGDKTLSAHVDATVFSGKSEWFLDKITSDHNDMVVSWSTFDEPSVKYEDPQSQSIKYSITLVKLFNDNPVFNADRCVVLVLKSKKYPGKNLRIKHYYSVLSDDKIIAVPNVLSFLTTPIAGEISKNIFLQSKDRNISIKSITTNSDFLKYRILSKDDNKYTGINATFINRMGANYKNKYIKIVLTDGRELTIPVVVINSYSMLTTSERRF